MSEMNPHYRAPIMKWNHIDIETPPGWQMTHHESGGYLHVKLYPPDASVPPEAMGEALLLLPPGHRVFVIRNDERADPLDHAYTPQSDGRCVVCGGNGSGDIEGMQE